MELSAFRQIKLILLLVVLLSVSCGRTGGSDGTFFTDIDWTAGVFEAEDRFKDFCESPRNDDAYDDQQGSTFQENFWLRSWSNNTYLWYDEIIDQDPGLFDSPMAYFDELKTRATTPSGNPKDQFHFTFDTEEWIDLSQSGVSAGYGADFVLLSANPPRSIVVSFAEANSPASSINLQRGARILTIDGVDVENGSDVDTLNAGLYPAAAGESHEFTILDQGATQPRDITLVSANVTADPVPLVSTITAGSDKIGYLLFNSHIATAEVELASAVAQLAADNVTDLILDLRYNSGGLLVIASQLSYMIAGPTATNGRIFEMLAFNDQHLSTNPVTGEPLEPTPFYDQTVGFSATAGQSLPSLDLPRVFVLTTETTCSASESIINGLRGIGVQVILIGDTTCGKPYGFYPTDNCGTTYFTVQFQGENDTGFGDYADGFSPSNTSGASGEIIAGCSVADDFDHQLGDEQEALIAAALGYRSNTSCPTAAFKAVGRSALTSDDAQSIRRQDSAKGVRANKFMTHFGQ